MRQWLTRNTPSLGHVRLAVPATMLFDDSFQSAGAVESSGHYAGHALQLLFQVPGCGQHLAYRRSPVVLIHHIIP